MMTVTQVSKEYNVSARMLRYYEKIGLISGKHKEDYAYRVYDEDDVRQNQNDYASQKISYSAEGHRRSSRIL